MLFLKTKINEASLFKNINFENVLSSKSKSAQCNQHARWNDQNKYINKTEKHSEIYFIQNSSGNTRKQMNEIDFENVLNPFKGNCIYFNKL